MGQSYSSSQRMIQVERLKPHQVENYPATSSRGKIKVFDTAAGLFIIQKPEVAAGGYARFYVGCNRAGEYYGFRELRLQPSKTQNKMYTEDHNRTVRHTTRLFGVENDVENMRLVNCLQSPFAAFVDPKRRKIYYAQALLHGTIKTVASIFRAQLPPEDHARLGLYFIREILTSIHAVHQAGIMHLDVKPDNILYFNKKFHISDFGESAKAAHKETAARGTQHYRAPEQLNDRVNTPAADIWATAITVMELLGCHPFLNSGLEASHYQEYREGQAEPQVDDYFTNLLNNYDAALRRLLEAMTEPQPDRRPTCSKILAHFKEAEETLLPPLFMQRIEQAWQHVPLPEPNIAAQLAALKANCAALNLVHTPANA